MENTCSDCKRFVQHYTFCNGKIMRVYCGHCGYPRTKIRKPDCKACGHYEQGIKDEENFANKEYLTKRLFEYVLNLELIPQIEDYKIQK